VGCSLREASASWGSGLRHFVRGASIRHVVEPLFAQRHEYSERCGTFLASEFSEAHREVTERLAEVRLRADRCRGVGRPRLPSERVRELIDRARSRPPKPKEAGLVGHLGYRDAVRDAVDRRWPDKPTLLYLSRYQRRWDGSASCAGRAVRGRAHRWRSVPSDRQVQAGFRSDGQRVRTPSPRRFRAA